MLNDSDIAEVSYMIKKTFEAAGVLTLSMPQFSSVKPENLTDHRYERKIVKVVTEQ